MRHIFTLLFAVLAFAACTQNDVEELSANRADVPEILTIGFEGDDTRIQLEAGKTVWTSGDLVSVFYKSDANQQWEYRGETGARVADLYCVDKGVESSRMNYVVVAYPYNPDYIISTASGNIETRLPAVQHYAEESYGVGENLMVSQSEFTQFSLKSVCGWLKIQLTGNGEKVTRLTLRGNNEEQLAGLIYVDTATAESTLASEMGSADDNNAGGNLVFDNAIVTELTLDCGEGVVLGAEATSFYFALPPQTFEGGFTVDVECEDSEPMTISTENSVTIQRNTIQPMATIELDADAINDTIYYTATAKVEAYSDFPWTFDTFGANIVSHEWNSETGEGVITFDANVATIGWLAFYECNSLTSITIPDSVVTIGDSAFYWCSRLTSITIPDSVTTIGWLAFYECNSLTSITISDSVTTIGGYAFYDCDSLTSITIPDSVTTIGDGAFQYCSSLTSVTIPVSVTTIGESAFYDCDSLTSITIPDSVTTIGDGAFQYCSSLTSVTIGDSVTTIGDQAFYNCDSLTSITIGDSVTTIGEMAFSGCYSLTSITIPDSVTTIGERAFSGCSSLTEFNGKFASEDGRCLIVDGTLNSFAPAGLTSYTIPDSVTTIGGSAFYRCTSLTSITIPDSVTTIGIFAFSSCSSLTEFNGKFASKDGRCLIVDGTLNSFAPAGLTSYTIPDSVTTIGERAFHYCYSLTSVTIGDSVTTIGDYAFYDCSRLTSVTIGDNVTTIGEAAFSCCDLTSVTIGDSVTTIGDYAFNSCYSLTSVTIGDSVTTIGFAAFAYCTNLISITIPDSVTTIGDSAFQYCSSLTSVYCEATTPPSLGGGDVFYYNAAGRAIYVPAASVETYRTAEYWSWYADAIVGYDFENGVVVE